MTTVERGLLEETTTFVAFSSVGFMRLIWRKSDKPWQPSEHDVLGRRSLVTSRQLPSLIKRTTPLAHRGGGPSQCGSLVLHPYWDGAADRMFQLAIVYSQWYRVLALRPTPRSQSFDLSVSCHPSKFTFRCYPGLISCSRSDLRA